jgi:hypothetical protein
VKYPVFSVTDEIVKIAKSSALILLETLKCPLMVDVLSSIVLKNDCISVELSSVSSI